MIGDNKEVSFVNFCRKCKFEKESEFDPKSPCYDCIEQPYNQDSHRPTGFKAKE